MEGRRAFTTACIYVRSVCVFIPLDFFFFYAENEVLCPRCDGGGCRRGGLQQSHTSVTAFDRHGGRRYLRGRHLSLAGRNHRPIKTPFSRSCIYNIIIIYTHEYNMYVIYTHTYTHMRKPNAYNILYILHTNARHDARVSFVIYIRL